MRLIISTRGQGRTKALITQSAKTGHYIVCRNRNDASYLAVMASDQFSVRIPFPLTYEEFYARKYSANISGVLIDDADAFLEWVSMVPVKIATFSIDPAIELGNIQPITIEVETRPETNGLKIPIGHKAD